MIPKLGRSCKAAADLSNIKSAHIPKFSLADLKDEELQKLIRLADKIRMRKNINKYVHGK